MKRKRFLVGFVLVGVILTIAGCEKNPEIRNRDGIAFATSGDSVENDFSIKENNNTQKLESMPTNIENEIITDISTMKIAAQINNLPIEGEVFMGEVEYKKIDIRKLRDVFLNDELNNRLNSKSINEDDENRSKTMDDIDNVESRQILDNENTGTWTLLENSTQKEIAQLSIDGVGTLSYINLELDKKYPNNTSVSIESLGEIDAPDTILTRVDAMNELLEIVNKIDGPEIEILNCLAYQDANGKGYYQLNFVPVFQGVALTNSLPCFSNSNIIQLFGRAIITEDGLMEITGNFMIEYKEKKIDKIFTVEEIIKIVTRYMKNGKIITTPEIPVYKIQYEYLPKYFENRLEIVPIWHFYFDESKIANIDATEFVVHGIGIGASDGELEFAY